MKPRDRLERNGTVHILDTYRTLSGSPLVPKPYSVSRLRADLFKVLDRVLETGVPVEVERNGRMLRIVAVEGSGRLANLKPRPDYLRVDPETLVHLDWSGEWRP